MMLTPNQIEDRCKRFAVEYRERKKLPRIIPGKVEFLGLFSYTDLHKAQGKDHSNDESMFCVWVVNDSQTELQTSRRTLFEEGITASHLPGMPVVVFSQDISVRPDEVFEIDGR